MSVTVATAVANSLSGVSAHYDLFTRLRAIAAAELWVELEVNTASATKWVIWKAPGYSGTEEIFMGIKTNQSIPSDYYNFQVTAFIGYVPGNSYETQPGYTTKGVPLWDQAIPFTCICNAQRMAFHARIQNTDVSFYIGKFLPYATPGQFPYPMLVSGMIAGMTTLRYSDVSSISMGYKGNTALSFRDTQGIWHNPIVYPFLETSAGSFPRIILRNTNNTDAVAAGDYGLYPLLLIDSTEGWGAAATGNIYGELDGLFFISGFDNATTNVVSIELMNYHVFRDSTRTGFKDYAAMRMN